MKNILLNTLVVLLINFALPAQEFKSNGQIIVNELNWDDPAIFKSTTRPLITGHGALSDSLSEVYGNKFEFYENDGEYYPVETWADYYFWYTQKYWYRFEQTPLVYEFHYYSENNIEMMKWIYEQSVFDNDVIPYNVALASPGLNRKRRQLVSVKKFERQNVIAQRNATTTAKGHQIQERDMGLVRKESFDRQSRFDEYSGNNTSGRAKQNFSRSKTTNRSSNSSAKPTVNKRPPSDHKQ